MCCLICLLPAAIVTQALPQSDVGGTGINQKKRKDYASQVQLLALRKGPLTSKLARASPRRFTGPA
eukprot:1161781-Pelagomonas_calceolata.AAC.2